MSKKISYFSIVLFFIFCSPLYSQDSNIVHDIGETYQMKSGHLNSAIATSKRNWKKFKNALINDDKMSVISMMSTGDIIGIENGSKVKYLGELKAFSGVAKIKILEGEWNGTVGYTFDDNLY
jgi:hypothetical protein